MRVIFHPDAHAEMIEQSRYYENKSEGLGADFLDAIEDATRRIAQSPNAGPIERINLRKRLCQVFLSQFSTKFSQTEFTSQRYAPTSAARLLAEAR